METLQLQQIITPKTSSNMSVIESTLNNIFPISSEENKIVGVKRLLGDSAQTLSDEQLETIITDFQYLIDTWLCEFEKNVFGGKTLIELLSEK